MAVIKPGCAEQAPPRYLEWFEGGASFQQAADKLAGWYESHLFLGDAFPYFNLSFGADDFAAYLGADLQLSDDATTSWPVHALHGLHNAKIRFDPNGKWWNRTAEFYTVLRRTLGDSIMIAAPTLSAGLDGLAGIYGVTNLLEAIIDEPEAVHEALLQIDAAFSDATKAVRELFEYDRYGSITRHGMYIEGDIGVPQCDFSCMISGEMFREFALPSIRHEISRLTLAEYHMDGPGAIRHLEDLCSLTNLHTIQWVPGAGEAAEQDWTWLYQKIQALGKSILAWGGPERLLALQNTLCSPAAFYTVHVKTLEQAQRFEEQLIAACSG